MPTVHKLPPTHNHVNDPEPTIWKQLEPTPAHLTYLLLSLFLISYTLFTKFIRNRLHLSEPPIALLFGILLGPRVLGWLTPQLCGSNGCSDGLETPDGVGGWGWGDNVVQEITRVIVGIQVFAVGVELPKFYASRHWRSVGMLLGPVMAFGWIVCAVFVALIFKTSIPTALTVAACLTPTDPILAASILSNSQFSERVPKRLKDMLSAESGCNDGVSFPFLFIGIYLLQKHSVGTALKSWFTVTILYQCLAGTLIGLSLGTLFNRVLRFSHARGHVDWSGFTVFYVLAALLSIGIGSTLGADDFLVAFGAGYGFARDGWFSKETKSTHLPNIIDLLLNSAMFVYLGTIIPWSEFSPSDLTPYVTPGRLIAFVVLVLLFRRLPVVLALYRWIPDVLTVREAWFCGHFGPMGVGALFLAMEARALLENDVATPDPHPPHYGFPYTEREKTVYLIWPVVCFTVFISTLVHGLSVMVISVVNHWRRPVDKRASLLGGETDPLEGMIHEVGDGESEPETEEEQEEEEEEE